MLVYQKDVLYGMYFTMKLSSVCLASLMTFSLPFQYKLGIVSRLNMSALKSNMYQYFADLLFGIVRNMRNFKYFHIFTLSVEC